MGCGAIPRFLGFLGAQRWVELVGIVIMTKKVYCIPEFSEKLFSASSFLLNHQIDLGVFFYLSRVRSDKTKILIRSLLVSTKEAFFQLTIRSFS
ncbi:MAG: hypothetical protein CM1200mP41_30440 [Gammaproteobacteria bacterium]|nr:MAG: hypothetical protein CM1200mP41_30440 [Gammaproteobacteria bacterium]